MTGSPETLDLVQGEDGGGDVAHSRHHASLPHTTHLSGKTLSVEASLYFTLVKPVSDLEKIGKCRGRFELFHVN